MNSQNMCDIIKLAKKNGDLGVDTKLSKWSLFVKYSSVLKYRSCFGL